MSETRVCGECRGAGYVPRLHGMDDSGYQPCPVCQGTARVWATDLLRDAEVDGRIVRTAQQEVGRLGNE